MATPSESSEEMKASEGEAWFATIQESISRLQQEYEEAYTRTHAAIGKVEADQRQMGIELGIALTKFGVTEEAYAITENKTMQNAEELKTIAAKVKIHDEQFEGKLIQLRSMIKDHGEHTKAAQQSHDQRILALETKILTLEEEQEDTKGKVQVITDIISTKLDHAKIQNATNERMEKEIDAMGKDISTIKGDIRDAMNGAIIIKQNLVDGLKRIETLESITTTARTPGSVHGHDTEMKTMGRKMKCITRNIKSGMKVMNKIMLQYDTLETRNGNIIATINAAMQQQEHQQQQQQRQQQAAATAAAQYRPGAPLSESVQYRPGVPPQFDSQCQMLVGGRGRTSPDPLMLTPMTMTDLGPPPGQQKASASAAAAAAAQQHRQQQQHGQTQQQQQQPLQQNYEYQAQHITEDPWTYTDPWSTHHHTNTSTTHPQYATANGPAVTQDKNNTANEDFSNGHGEFYGMQQ